MFRSIMLAAVTAGAFSIAGVATPSTADAGGFYRGGGFGYPVYGVGRTFGGYRGQYFTKRHGGFYGPVYRSRKFVAPRRFVSPRIVHPRVFHPYRRGGVSVVFGF